MFADVMFVTIQFLTATTATDVKTNAVIWFDFPTDGILEVVLVADFIIEVAATVITLSLRFHALRVRLQKSLTIFLTAAEAELDVFGGGATMLSLIVITLEAIVADIGVLTIAFQTTTGVIMIVYMHDHDLLLVFVVGAESDGFMTSASVNTDESVLRESSYMVGGTRTF